MGTFTDSRLVFQAEWYDQNAELVRRYQVMFYPVDNTVEMFDVKNRFVSLIHSIQYILYNIHIHQKFVL